MPFGDQEDSSITAICLTGIPAELDEHFAAAISVKVEGRKSLAEQIAALKAAEKELADAKKAEVDAKKAEADKKKAAEAKIPAASCPKRWTNVFVQRFMRMGQGFRKGAKNSLKKGIGKKIVQRLKPCRTKTRAVLAGCSKQ